MSVILPALIKETEIDVAGEYVIGDYIELRGVESGTDPVGEIMRLLPPPAVLRADIQSFPLVSLGAGVEMFIDECDDDLTILAIGGVRAVPGAQRATARRVFDTLAEGTGWSLRWTADDEVGPIASRPAVSPSAHHGDQLILVTGS